MKLTKRIIAICTVALIAAFTFSVLPAYATKGDPYNYTVRVYGGNEGTYASQGVYETTVAAGGEMTLSIEDAVPTDDKYYVKGFRISGQDGLFDRATFNVNEDMDFVVAYGVRGDQVAYTLSFVEYGTGRQLADPVTYYGNVGDKPVVAYEYIDGYRPRYLNITGTLQESGNDWTFEYIPATTVAATTEGGTTTGGTTTGGTATGGTATGGTATGGTATGGTATGGTATGGTAAGGTEGTAAGGTATGGTAAGGTAAGGAAGAAGTEGTAIATEPQTEEIRDIDNPLASGTDTSEPVSNGKVDESKADQGLPILPIIIGVIVAAAIVIGVVGFLTSRKRRQ